MDTILYKKEIKINLDGHKKLTYKEGLQPPYELHHNDKIIFFNEEQLVELCDAIEDIIQTVNKRDY